MSNPEPRAVHEPVIIPRPDHIVSRANISGNAQKVLYRLKQAGYESFLVGGAVRDLLLGREPKDFDIVTNASPEQVRKLFRNCRLIGRRFRLAHVYFGQEVLEVATFRAAPDAEGTENHQRAHDQEGRILRDNAYGTIGEDVWRRDFTANALYYNIRDFSIWDYSGGVRDVEDGVMRLIGDPEQRYREDPVRMLRAVRFAAKLGFRIHPDSEKPLHTLGELLDNVPPARLLDESLKMFLSGHALQSFELLRHYDLFRYLFPITEYWLAQPEADSYRTLLTDGLANTDKRVAEGKPVTPVFLFTLLLWEAIRQGALKLQEQGESEAQALRIATSDVARAQFERVSIPRRHTQTIREIVAMQPRFHLRTGKRALRLLEHPRFRAAYDFLLMRCAAGEEDMELGEFWTKMQELTPVERAGVTGNANPPKRRRRRRGRRSNAAKGADPQ